MQAIGFLKAPVCLTAANLVRLRFISGAQMALRDMKRTKEAEALHLMQSFWRAD